MSRHPHAAVYVWRKKTISGVVLVFRLPPDTVLPTALYARLAGLPASRGSLSPSPVSLQEETRSLCTVRGLNPNRPYQVLVAVLSKSLLFLILILGPAIGDHVIHDGRVVDGFRLAPGHLQCCLVQRLHLHVDGWRAAD